jgi:hypothetical protein
MEDASAFDLDWFWRGWFYSTDYVDLGIKEVKKYFVTTEPSEEIKNYRERRGRFGYNDGPYVYLLEENNPALEQKFKVKFDTENIKPLKDYLTENADKTAKKLHYSNTNCTFLRIKKIYLTYSLFFKILFIYLCSVIS